MERVIKQTGETYASLVALTLAQVAALKQMQWGWARSARRTEKSGNGRTVHGATGSRLTEMGLARRSVRDDGGDWVTIYTITRKGLAAIGGRD